MLDLTIRRRETKQNGAWQIVEQPRRWRPEQTAAIVCDMWNVHWCRSATARVTEMAPRMNELVSELRRRGVLIIHCPSGTMESYKDYPGRRLAQSAPQVKTEIPIGPGHPDEKQEPPLPIDDSDQGCDDEPQCVIDFHPIGQIATIEIKDEDAITDSAEAFYLMRQRGITNMLIMGVHENMCILGRPFGIRQMLRQGQQVLLVRDLTDTMYNPRMRPFVDHFTGTDLVTEHIERYLCPTITSDQIIGGKLFRFAADKRPV